MLKKELEIMIDGLEEKVSNKVWNELYTGLENGAFMEEDVKNWSKRDVEIFISDVKYFYKLG